MNTRRLTIQDHLDDTGHTLPAEWNRLEREWSAARASKQACEYTLETYGLWRLVELIKAYQSGRDDPGHITSIAKDLVVENDVLLMLLDVIGALTDDPSSLAYCPEALLSIARHSTKASKLPHAHLLLFANDAATFLETRLGSGDLTLAQTRADALARRSFMKMLANVLWAAEPERRAA